MFRRMPIARQIIALVAISVIATAAAMVAITFIGPPPRPAPTDMGEVALALQGKAVKNMAARPLLHSISATEPDARSGEARDRAMEAWLSRQLGSDPENLRAYADTPGPWREGSMLFGDGSFAWKRDGDWSLVRTGAHPTSRRWWWTVSAATLLLLAAIIAFGWFSARAITRPLERLADAARNSRSGQPWNEDIEGPPELTVVSDALADYQRSQAEHVAQRTRMLSAIAHDMGTPLTRLAFRLEALPREQREAALSEIEIMRRLIADSLALDRSGSEPADRFDLADLASAMVQEYRRLDAPVRTGTIEHAPVVASSLALRRLIQNLIDNAVRYGKAATVSVSRTGQRAQLHIRDEGPGFSPEMLEHGCQPFARGEVSRNRETGGSGLGLAIADAIVAQHQGTLELRNFIGGGAEAVVSLPLAPPDWSYP
ncbi:MAG: HAMP domain-containing sensor histidine kinase [Novosphingobium sp.]|nr:HAMP domain-containing histidine kinase [Novosphingobium sp.]